MKEFVFWGAGDRGKKLYDIFHQYGIEIKYWIDSDEKKWNEKLEGKVVYPPTKIQNDKNIQVCISTMDLSKNMRQKVLEYGVQECNVYSFCEAIVNCVSKYRLKNKLNKNTKEKNIILDCFNGLGLGGVESWSMDLLRELRKEKYEAYLISPRGEYEVDETINKRVLWTNIKTDTIFDQGNIETILKDLEHMVPFVFISSFVNDALLAACILKKECPEKIKIISIIHQGLPEVYIEYSELKQYIDKYIAVSKDIQEGMIKCGISQEKVLHMTCPVKCVKPYEKNYCLNSDSPLKIGYAGRIESIQKRIDYLIPFVKELEKFQTNYKIKIAGKGSYQETLIEEINKYDLEKRVDYVGEIERMKISEFWSEQDVCINLSDYEGRSISVMEAMANGVVPVVTATSGVYEDIDDEVNGYIVPVGDYKTMATKIDYLARNREVLKLFGEKSHELMKKKANMSDHMIFWKKILCEIK